MQRNSCKQGLENGKLYLTKKKTKKKLIKKRKNEYTKQQAAMIKLV